MFKIFMKDGRKQLQGQAQKIQIFQNFFSETC